MPEARVDLLAENVASMMERDVMILNGFFGRVPVEIEAGQVSWVRRARLYWCSWDLLPGSRSQEHQ